jgi:ribosomal protein S3
MGMIKDWTSRKHEEHWQFVCGQGQARNFLKKTLCKTSWVTAQLSRNQLRIVIVLLTGQTLVI